MNTINSCCQDPENLKEIERRTSDDGSILVVRQCAICERRHYELQVKPIIVNAKMK